MYDEHFGLTTRPFQLTPDPAFWYETATHRRAMAYLGYGLAQGEGFIVVTGDIGAGKTTLMRHLVDTLDREALNPITIVSTAIDPSDLLRIVAQGLGVDPAGRPKAELLSAIERGLHAVARTGRRTLLIVDEAQALPTASLEELRMLSNFQAGGHALLQIVLLGQPEFRAAMGGAGGLEELRQRVIAIHHLEPMAADEVAPYVRHRLAVAGWTGKPGFAEGAFAALYRYSDGVPRRLNQLANRVMLHAAVEGIDTVTAATVDTVAADLFGDLPAASAVAPSTVEAPVAVAPQPEVVEEAVAVPEPEPEAPAVVADVTAEVEEPALEEPVASIEPIAIRPFRHSWLAAPEEQPAASAEIEAVEPPVAELEESDAPEPAAAPTDPADRLAALEARMDEQDEALRRVLTLMVDWMEGDHAAPAVGEKVEPEPLGYVPIRGAAA